MFNTKILLIVILLQATLCFSKQEVGSYSSESAGKSESCADEISGCLLHLHDCNFMGRLCRKTCGICHLEHKPNYGDSESNKANPRLASDSYYYRPYNGESEPRSAVYMSGGYAGYLYLLPLPDVVKDYNYFTPYYIDYTNTAAERPWPQVILPHEEEYLSYSYLPQVSNLHRVYKYDTKSDDSDGLTFHGLPVGKIPLEVLKGPKHNLPFEPHPMPHKYTSENNYGAHLPRNQPLPQNPYPKIDPRESLNKMNEKDLYSNNNVKKPPYSVPDAHPGSWHTGGAGGQQSGHSHVRSHTNISLYEIEHMIYTPDGIPPDIRNITAYIYQDYGEALVEYATSIHQNVSMVSKELDYQDYEYSDRDDSEIPYVDVTFDRVYYPDSFRRSARSLKSENPTDIAQTLYGKAIRSAKTTRVTYDSDDSVPRYDPSASIHRITIEELERSNGTAADGYIGMVDMEESSEDKPIDINFMKSVIARSLGNETVSAELSRRSLLPDEMRTIQYLTNQYNDKIKGVNSKFLDKLSDMIMFYKARNNPHFVDEVFKVFVDEPLTNSDGQPLSQEEKQDIFMNAMITFNINRFRNL